MKWLVLFRPAFWITLMRTARASARTTSAALRSGATHEEAKKLGAIAAQLERERMDDEDGLR